MSKQDRIYMGLQAGGALKTPLAPNATNILSPPVSSEGIGLEREDMDIDETLGSRAPSAREYGGRIFEGDIEGAGRPNSLGLFLSMMFGAPVTTVVSPAGADPVTDPAVYRHTWNPTAAGKSPLPASIWTVNNDVSPAIIDKYVGAKGNELSLEVEANGYLTFTMGVAAYLLDQTSAEPTGVPQDLTKKWAFHQVKAFLAVAGGAEGSVGLMDFGFDYSNNLVTDQFVLGSKEVENMPEGNIEPEVSFTPASDIQGHYRRSLLDTPEDVALRLLAEGPVIKGTFRNTLELQLARLQYTEAPVDIDAGETLSGVEVTAIPVINESDNSFMTISITNGNNGNNYRP